MNVKLINETSQGSLDGTMTFPQVLMVLHQAGIERYTADLVRLRKTHYSVDQKVHETMIDPALSSKIADIFDEEEIKKSIASIQQNQIDYRSFLERIMQAGCCHYEVYLKGSQAIYFGRDGSQHIEHFPK